MSDLNDLDLGLDLEAAAPQPLPERPPKQKRQIKKKAATPPPPQVEDLMVEEDEEDAAPVAPREERVKIVIDEVPGMSNFEVVGVNGTLYQIKRGVPVEVPIGVMYALQDAVMTQTEIRRNPITGEREEIVRHHSSIPWRRV